jgi:hypothetical protein
MMQMEMMAASSVNLVSILTKMQDGNEVDKNKKEAEKSILKGMGPTQRNLFMTSARKIWTSFRRCQCS